MVLALARQVQDVMLTPCQPLFPFQVRRWEFVLARALNVLLRGGFGCE